MVGFLDGCGGSGWRVFVDGLDRGQTTLFPECSEDWIDEDNPVRVIDAFVASIDLGELGFDSVVREATGRPAYHPSVLLKLYIGKAGDLFLEVRQHLEAFGRLDRREVDLVTAGPDRSRSCA
jgi:hypothetical protein